MPRRSTRCRRSLRPPRKALPASVRGQVGRASRRLGAFCPLGRRDPNRARVRRARRASRACARASPAAAHLVEQDRVQARRGVSTEADRHAPRALRVPRGAREPRTTLRRSSRRRARHRKRSAARRDPDALTGPLRTRPGSSRAIRRTRSRGTRRGGRSSRSRRHRRQAPSRRPHRPPSHRRRGSRRRLRRSQDAPRRLPASSCQVTSCYKSGRRR